MKRLLVAAAAFLLAAVFCVANEIRDIQTQVVLFKSGNAQVIQKWDLTVTEGTEWYIPIDNPGQSRILDFNVYENNNKYISDGRNWNSKRSLEAKAGRSGIVEKGGGSVELCWGLGSHGDHVYYIAYTIENLVQSYPECDGFHWHFLNDEWQAEPKHASITIQNETGGDSWYWESKDSCNVRFWGFGMVGDSALENGQIHFESTEPFQYKSFFSALVGFDKGLFQPSVTGKGTFEALKEEAMKGSDYEDKMSLGDYLALALLVLLFVVLPILIVGYILFLIIRKIWRRASGNRYDKKIFDVSKITGWARDVPFDANPAVLYSLLQTGDYCAKNENKAFSDIVGAYFLKWIQDGILAVERDPNKEDRVNLRFVSGKEDCLPQSGLERTIYNGAREAAGDNLLLEAGEFKRWSYKNDRQVAAWPKEAKYSGRNIWQAASKEERRKAVEFKNFLEDFTLAGERSAPEVGIWKKYMIMAAGLGIADKVAKNFEKLFPQVMEEYSRQTNMFNTATTYTVINSVNLNSSSMMSSALDHQRARAAARAAQARRSGGGGGSISFGGGGGGFGGGHGGGSR